MLCHSEAPNKRYKPLYDIVSYYRRDTYEKPARPYPLFIIARPKTVSRLGIQLFQLLEDLLHITAARGLLVRTQRLLLRELQLFCHLPDILLMQPDKGGG